MNELQELNGEFNVPKPPWPQFDLVVHIVGWNVRRHTLAHPLDLLHKTWPLRCGPNHGLESTAIAIAEVAIPRKRTRLDERLELPITCPSLVVRDVRLEGSHQCPVFAFGAQIGVNLPETRLNPKLRDAPGRVASKRCGASKHRLLIVALWNLGDIDHINIAQVVELCRSSLPHTNDRQWHIAWLQLVLSPRQQ